jgi:hypothetical protein
VAAAGEDRHLDRCERLRGRWLRNARRNGREAAPTRPQGHLLSRRRLLESYRPDAAAFPRSLLGNAYSGYPDERWLDIRRIDRLAPILRKRFDLCAGKGFDAVEPDNVAGYENETGFPLSGRDQLRFNRWVAREVHRRGMSVALKNDPEQVRQLLRYFDFAVVEECFAYEECGRFSPFVAAGRAVFEAEYESSPASFCPAAAELRFSAIRKGYDLFAAPWIPCG